MFQKGNRYDVLGLRPTLDEIDEQMQISRDVTDEAILAYTRSLNDREDPRWTICSGNSRLINCSRSSCEVLSRWKYHQMHFSIADGHRQSDRQGHVRCTETTNYRRVRF